MPRMGWPGTGASMRMGAAARAKARSLTKARILLTLTLRRLMRPSRSSLNVAGLHAELGDDRSLLDLYPSSRHAKAGQGFLNISGFCVPLSYFGCSRFMACLASCRIFRFVRIG
jgi:hypothetical protein